MKRRDLIKSSLATIGASTIALSGCSETDNSSYESIIPKQTAQYEFSAPLPFNFKTIDEMAEFNSTIKKSQIKTLYNNAPPPLVNRFNSLIHEIRGKSDGSIKKLDDFGQYVKYALDKGFKFTYLMNSSRSVPEAIFMPFKDEFASLLEYLYKIGVRDIKVGNRLIIEYINKYAPNEFNLQVSTCFDLRNICQYSNLFERYPNFNLIDMARDEARNFDLFKSLKKLYPNIKIEILANEKCSKGCANLYNNCESICRLDSNKYNESGKFAFIKSVAIYPWDFAYYSSLGINNFKYILRHQLRYNFKDASHIKLALNIIENGYENFVWGDLFKAGWIPPYMVNDKNKNIKLSKIVPLFPKIKHFINHGNECDTKCKVECNYCYECADELVKVLQLG